MEYFVDARSNPQSLCDDDNKSYPYLVDRHTYHRPARRMGGIYIRYDLS